MPAKRQTPGVKRGGRVAKHDGLPHMGTRERDHVTEIQRARMITAMIDAASERGRAKATVAHVVARSGVSRRTFYEVFDDFEDCFLAALDYSIARASDYVLGAYDPAEKWRNRIRAGLAGLLEFLEDEPAMGRLCIVETLGAGRKIHERRLQLVDALIAAVDEGRGKGRSGMALPALTSEGVVGGVLSVLHARLLSYSDASHGPRHSKDMRPSKGIRQVSERGGSLLELTGALMGMIVLPYLGPAAAQKETVRPAPERRVRRRAANRDPLRDMEMRLTYRTVRVLLSIATIPGSSNREVGSGAGIDDQGQISKLLSRLEKLGLIENNGMGQVRGAPNAWVLTKKGIEVEQLVSRQAPIVAMPLPVGRQQSAGGSASRRSR
jgi:AcrR family transcriptional regulator